jgi:dihydroorotate dehydrogenase (fumarate)
MDLTTTYLGMRLPHPLIVGAGPLTDDPAMARALEDAGAAMLVLRSLYEEEITGEQLDAMDNVDGHTDSFAEAGTFEPDRETALGPDEYLDHLRRVKNAVSIPVLASLNGATRGGWLSYARLLEQAGADGLELHLYHAASDMTATSADVEREFIDIVREVKRTVRVPVAVKLAPLLTAFANFAKRLDDAGADALVLFTRFHRADLDVEELEVVRTLPLSDSSELPLRLRGAAAVSGRIHAAIAITGGVHTGTDVVKATMAGAHGVQLVSALLRHGPDRLRAIRHEIERWMLEHEWTSLSDMRGNMGLGRLPDPAAYERANFRMALR